MDSSFDVKEQNVNFINNIRIKQGNQKFEAKIILRFYVKGLPMYKIESDIRDFISEYTELSGKINLNLDNESISSVVKIKLLEFSTSLKDMNTNLIIPLRLALSTREDLERLYMEVINYSAMLKEYREYIENLNK